jgi:hypothetical protein
MDHLKTRTRRGLEEQKESDLFARIGWSVQDAQGLQDASERQVRRYNLLATLVGLQTNTSGTSPNGSRAETVGGI